MTYIVRLSNHLGERASRIDGVVAAIEKAMEFAGRGAKNVTIEAPDGRIYGLTEFPDLLAVSRTQ